MRRWIRNLSLLTSLLFIASCSLLAAPVSSDTPLSNHDLIEASTSAVEVQTAFGDVLEVFDAPNLSLTERRTRAAAVKVRSLRQEGHGSGTYMIAHGRRIVVTAAHVVRTDSSMAIDGRDGETVVGQVVFKDEDTDIAILVVPELESRTAIRYRPQIAYDERIIGTRIAYTGFPSHHDLLTIRGYVASLEDQMVVTNMFGWFGSSGSGVFDHRGRLLGVVSGFDVGRFGFGLRIPLESVVWVAPASQLDHEMVKIRIMTAYPVGTVHAFPGAAAPRRGE